MPLTTPDSLPYPLNTDSPDIPRDIGNLAIATQAALTRQSAAQAVYASTAARDAAIPAPVEGMSCYVSGVGGQVYRSGAWWSGTRTVLTYAGSYGTGLSDVAVTVNHQPGWQPIPAATPPYFALPFPGLWGIYVYAAWSAPRTGNVTALHFRTEGSGTGLNFQAAKGMAYIGGGGVIYLGAGNHKMVTDLDVAGTIVEGYAWISYVGL